ncbi:uncharacterized protein FIBRA_04662 [Fibroporia radiculosa]|uniref:Sugar phosphate transporter domain-containing protein n=1 Tax=Fibroporia radiculosa TaxID=599839 RepID=J4H330_9APHY|nr:uncharacterized protein FIBRA_04662 [Fibroporia radiculosa]CCM02559.1 predicted protein [Fibroporia radiculosa]
MASRLVPRRVEGTRPGEHQSDSGRQAQDTRASWQMETNSRATENLELVTTSAGSPEGCSTPVRLVFSQLHLPSGCPPLRTGLLQDNRFVSLVASPFSSIIPIDPIMLTGSHSWVPTQQRPPSTAGWKTFDARDKPSLTSSKSWLASFSGADNAHPYNTSEKHPWESADSLHDPAMRLRNMKRSLLRRMSSISNGGVSTPSAFIRQTAPIAPSSSASTLRFALLCALWYTTSALSSNTGKTIMMQFRYPITLTFVQFAFVAGYCLFFMSPIIRFSKFKSPTKAIFQSTLPMGLFQVGGHIFSSMAISRIPVSTVHTIKALSPLFTVAAYALLFHVRYSVKTYLSLFPLTLGVILACSSDMSVSNAIGLLCAFGSALVFVSSNIFFKKIMPSGSTTSSSSHKLDKLNLLFYSSSMAFVLMIPIWAYYDLPVLLAAVNDPEHVAHPSHGHSHHSVVYDFFANGTVHFAQNIIAFILLAQTSPVTYSIASLIKRVAVICIAIAWFAQPVKLIQAFGIALTFAGLYMYNQAKGDVEQGERSMRRVEAARAFELPSIRADVTPLSSPPPAVTVEFNVADATASGYGRPRARPAAVSQSSSPYANRASLPKAPSLPPRSNQTHRPHPLSYSQTHNAPNLRIQITPVVPAHANANVNTKTDPAASPIDLYPSPPPSLDSPPTEEPTHSGVSEWIAHRQGPMATGHQPPRQYETAAPQAAMVL